jgi:hypothetical protein
MLPRKATCVVATPQDQVVRFSDDDQFFLFLHRCLRWFLPQQAEDSVKPKTHGAIFKFRPAYRW